MDPIITKAGRDPRLLLKQLLPYLRRNAQIDATISTRLGLEPLSRDRTGYDDLGQFSGFEPKPVVHVGGKPLSGLQNARRRR